MPKPKKGFDPEEMDYSGGSHFSRQPITFQPGRDGRIPHSEDGNPARMLMDSPRTKTHPGVRVPGPYRESREIEMDVVSPQDPQEIQRTRFEESDIPESNDLSKNFYTMTGTIKRGGKKKQEVVEVQIQLTEQQVSKLQQSYVEEEKEKEDDSKCGMDRGPHILLFTILFIPFGFFASLGYSFYIGVISWYNIYLYLSEERTIWHKIFLCPLLILFFPFLIVVAAVGLGIYGAVIQVSWFFSSWLKEMRDLEKGFYGWLFNKLGIEKCCPYEVVILDDPAPGNITMTLSRQQGATPNQPCADSQV